MVDIARLKQLEDETVHLIATLRRFKSELEHELATAEAHTYPETPERIFVGATEAQP